MNKATIKVTYPDGCRAEWKTRDDAPLAKDAARFADWLMAVAESIRDGVAMSVHVASGDR